MVEINSKDWWEKRALDYMKKNDRRIRTTEDSTAAKHIRGSVIEVGCAFGGFTEALPSTVQYLGIDVSGTMIHKARQFYPGRIFIRKGLDEAVKIMGGAFDTACAFQLLEHFPEVKEPLEMLSKLAKKQIIFTVPRGIPQNHQRKNDGHLIGWEDEGTVKRTFGFGEINFWKGNDNHICGTIDLGGDGK